MALISLNQAQTSVYRRRAKQQAVVFEDLLAVTNDVQTLIDGVNDLADDIGSAIKVPARAASTANVVIASGPSAIDGVTMVAGNRVLLKDQSTGSQNGVYVWNGLAVAMTRATDFDESSEVTSGILIVVEEGTVNDNRVYELVTPNPIIVGTTSLTFLQVGGAGGGTVTSVSSGNLSPLFTVVVSTATTTPAFAFTAVNQAANIVYAGPGSGAAAAPTFRALVSDDIPNLDAAKITTGVFGIPRGGTGFSSYTVGDILYADTTTTLAKLPSGTLGTFLYGQGVGTAPIWSTLVLPNGVTTGAILYGSSSNIVGQLLDVAVGNALLSGGAGTAPTWGQINLATTVTGVLPIANGGTNLSALGTALQQLRVNAGATALEYFTDISATGFVNGGNAFGANATIGLTDNFGLSILTNNTSRVNILNTGEVGIGTAGLANTILSVSTTGSLVSGTIGEKITVTKSGGAAGTISGHRVSVTLSGGITNSNMLGTVLDVGTSGSGNTASNGFGLQCNLSNASGSTFTNAWSGYFSSGNSGTAGTYYGVYSTLSNIGGSATMTLGSALTAQFTNTGTITTARGVDISGWVNVAGVWTTTYGIYMDTSIDRGTTRYALYSLSTSQSILSGALTIGSSITTSTRLNITGSGTSSATKPVYVENSGSLELFSCTDDGRFNLGLGGNANASSGLYVGGLRFLNVVNTSGVLSGSDIFIGTSSGNAFTGTNNNNVGIGYQSLQTLTSGSDNIAIGQAAGKGITTGQRNISLIGSNSITTGSNNIMIGYDAGPASNMSQTISFGEAARPSAAGDVIFGGNDIFNNFYLGAGIQSSSTIPITINVTKVVTGVTDGAGGSLTLRSGGSTGAGAGGAIIFQTSPAAGAGTAQNALATALTISGSGNLIISSGKTFQLGNAAVTGLVAGVLSALTNASIVILDSTGQAYRVPCII